MENHVENLHKMMNTSKKGNSFISEIHHNMGINYQNFSKCVKKIKSRLLTIANEHIYSENTYQEKVVLITPIYDEICNLESKIRQIKDKIEICIDLYLSKVDKKDLKLNFTANYEAK